MIHLYLSMSLSLSLSLSLCTILGKDAAQYKSTVDCFLRIAREEGLRGLYKGSLPRMGRVVPGQVETAAATVCR